MDTRSIKRVVVIGTGLMGPGIAQTFAAAGRQVFIFGRTQQSVDRGLALLESNLHAMERAELLDGEDVSRIRSAVRGTTDLEDAAAGADLVVESVIEELPLKRSIFSLLDRVCPEHTLICTNTSGLPVTEISAEMAKPERAATTHYWNPPHLMPLVEIVKGERTSLETVELLRALLLEVGKRPVVVWKDVPGQLGNRIFHAIKREAMYIVQEGIATAEDVDLAIKMGFGLRFPVHGPLEHSDLNGLEGSLRIESYLFKSICNDDRPLPILEEKVAKGERGLKDGKGFYDWSKRDAAEVRRIRDEFLMARVKEMYPPRRPVK
ncbi:MAG TPA: 3-hydroxyacyl-CoA dehydrogenase family protein [Chloroflexota bacterium]|nr:3-hydroxyacyl-CoA dehydrogenase family protein [Chloroflexota bacterium]